VLCSEFVSCPQSYDLRLKVAGFAVIGQILAVDKRGYPRPELDVDIDDFIVSLHLR
jgi:hypothetical protein